MCAKKILLIENDPEDQELFMNVIDEVSPTSGCYAVYSSRDAVELLEEGNFIPDYIFCSNGLPGSSVSELISFVRKNKALKNTPLIVTGTLIHGEEAHRLKSVGASGTMMKCAGSQMRKVLEKYLISDVPQGESVALKAGSDLYR